MRKSTLFISVVLTTFMLAVLFGVATAYQKIVGANQTAAVQPQPTTTVEMVSASPVPIATIAPTQVANLAPEAAAALAGKVLGRTDLYSVQVTQFQGANVYLVTFSSGDIVYVSMDGQILSISKLPVTTTVIARKGRSGNSSKSSGGEHDGGDD